MDEVFHAAPRMQNASHSHKLASVPTGQKRCARIAAAQRARWAKVKGQQKVVKGRKLGKRTMPASARRKIAAAQRAR